MRLKTTLFFLLIIFSLLFPLGVFAQSNFRQGESVVLDKNEVVSENYFAAGELVSLEGTVNGDAYLAGGNIVVEGTVNGDVIAAGGTISIRGTVTGDVRLAGGQINVSGNIGKNVTAVGGQITITEESEVAGSLTAAGGNIEVNAPLGGGMQVAGGALTVSDTVAGNITYAGDKLWLASDANVDGDVTYFSEKDAQVASGATISGNLKKTVPPVDTREARETAEGVASGLASFWTFVSFVSALILGALLIHFAPNYLVRVANRMGVNFLTNLGIGFLTAILTPIVFLVLLITVFGMPLAFIFLFLFILAFYIAKVFVALYVGQLIMNRFQSKQSLFVTFLLGLIIYYFIGVIPFIGPLVQFIFVLAAVGALLIEKKEFYLSLKQKKLL